MTADSSHSDSFVLGQLFLNFLAPPIQFGLFENFASWKSWYDDRFEVLYKQIRRKNFQMPLDSISKLYLFPMDTLSEISASVNQILTARISKNF